MTFAHPLACATPVLRAGGGGVYYFPYLGTPQAGAHVCCNSCQARLADLQPGCRLSHRARFVDRLTTVSRLAHDRRLVLSAREILYLRILLDTFWIFLAFRRSRRPLGRAAAPVPVTRLLTRRIPEPGRRSLSPAFPLVFLVDCIALHRQTAGGTFSGPSRRWV